MPGTVISEPTLERPAYQKWVAQTSVSLQRHSLERAILNLGMIEALALIRAAYRCTLHEAQEIHEAIKKCAR